LRLEIYWEFEICDLEFDVSSIPIEEEEKKIIDRCVLRLARKNSSALHQAGSVVKSFFSGSSGKRFTSKGFDFDPGVNSPEMISWRYLFLSGPDEDIEEISKRYA
jgi:hypothetical protein